MREKDKEEATMQRKSVARGVRKKDRGRQSIYVSTCPLSRLGRRADRRPEWPHLRRENEA